MKYILLAIFIVLSSFAQARCKHAQPDSLVDDFTPLFKAATDEQVENAYCRNQKIPDSEQIFDLAASTRPRVDKVVNGVSFSNEDPYLIELFEKLTTKVDPIGDKIVNHNNNVKNKFSIDSKCMKVKCALESIWPQNGGSKLLYLLDQYDLNASHLRNSPTSKLEKYRPISSDELDTIIRSVHDMPTDQFIKRRASRQIAHVDASSAQDKNTYANAAITLFDLWGNQSDTSKQYTLFHEMAHNLSDQYGDLDESSDWLALSSWKDSGKIGISQKTIYEQDKEHSSKMCSIYAMTSPGEDFAESVTAYRYNPKLLKTTNPKKYDFIKDKVFKGREYTSQTLCSSIALTKLRKMKGEYINNLNHEISIEELESMCKGRVSLSRESKKLDECIKANYKKAIFEKIESDSFKSSFMKNNVALKSYLQDELRSSILTDKSLSYKINSLSQKKAIQVKALIDSQIEKANTELSEQILTKEAIDKNIKQITSTCGFQILKLESLDSCTLSYMASINSNKISASSFLDEQSKEEVKAMLLDSAKDATLDQDAKRELDQLSKKLYKDLQINAAQKMEFTLNWEIKKREWRKLSPELFCKKYYHNSSNKDFSLYLRGIKNTQSNQKLAGQELYSTCLQMQAPESKRFVLTEEAMNQHYSSKP